MGKPEEILNIEYHTKRLLLKALNKFRSKTKAYMALGISERQLYNLISRYKVRMNEFEVYVIDEPEFKNN